MEEVVVLYPTPVIGHLISMVELGKLILSHKPSLSIHILIISLPYNAGSTDSYISNVSATISSIFFHHLPTITLPTSTTSIKNYETLTFEVHRLSNPHVHKTLLSISKTSTINAFILDLFCATSLSVSSQLNIPSYFFYTSGISTLSLFIYLPTIHQNTNKSFKDLNSFLDVPGLPPILSSDVPKPILERGGKAYEFFLDSAICASKSAGIIVNSFELLESRAFKAISDGLCVPNGNTPPVYCIGPLIRTINQTEGGQPECLTWLDAQPCGSVVFLCFGSMGLFSMEQLREIATGLERSGQKFLWVVRNPPSDNQSLVLSPQTEPDLNFLLPDGFLDRTRGVGMLVKSWAPQVAILNHNSVGGFVTHCGWNSILEAVCAGVPMVAWPLYAEQKVNKVALVEELKIALPINETENGFVTALEMEELKIALPINETENGFVTASEVEKRVTELMDSELGNSIRQQIISMKNAAEAAWCEGGSSRVALSLLAKSWKAHHGEGFSCSVPTTSQPSS